jgi:hypothetical protein
MPHIFDLNTAVSGHHGITFFEIVQNLQDNQRSKRA